MTRSTRHPTARVGILHPGEMGASIAAAATARAEVLWASEHRSPETHRRASQAELTDVTNARALCDACDVLISICPPAAAVEQASKIRGLGFDGLYVDANAISPHTAREIRALFADSARGFVDGGIVGPPAWRTGTTRLYLSGPAAIDIADIFVDSPLLAMTIDGGAGAASALKMCYAAYTKGSAALLLAIRTLAHKEGVEPGLLGEWARSQPELERRSEASAVRTAPKAWRFAGEMSEIAATFESHDLPAGFHLAAAEIYRRLEHFKDSKPDAARVFKALADG